MAEEVCMEKQNNCKRGHFYTHCVQITLAFFVGSRFLSIFAALMKKLFLHNITLVLLSLISIATNAQPLTYSDSVEISLLTCSPGQASWAQFGHTALRYNDMQNGNDIAINYGVFDSNQPNFSLRFIFGLTDYRVATQPMELFLAQYDYEGRGVTEQVLNLTKEEKYKIYKALTHNLRPENVVYRYNFFYDNCTTRAYHIIANNVKLAPSFAWSDKQDPLPTYREMIHQWNKDYPWTRFGEDLLLGKGADAPVETKEQTLFLPDNLRKHFALATHNNAALVKETRTLISPQPIVDEGGFPLSPLAVSVVVAVVMAAIMAVEIKLCRLFWQWELALMLLTGTMGLLFLAMVFSKHPCVDKNAMLFFFNPLSLVFAYRAVKRTRKMESDWWWVVYEISLFSGFIITFTQHLPIPMYIVALFLLINVYVHRYVIRKAKANKSNYIK